MNYTPPCTELTLGEHFNRMLYPPAGYTCRHLAPRSRGVTWRSEVCPPSSLSMKHLTASHALTYCRLHVPCVVYRSHVSPPLGHMCRRNVTAARRLRRLNPLHCGRTPNSLSVTYVVSLCNRFRCHACRTRTTPAFIGHLRRRCLTRHSVHLDMSYSSTSSSGRCSEAGPP